MEIADLTVALLAGGLGSRLRSVVHDRPKALAEIGHRPFLAYLLDQLAGARCRVAVLCTGHLGEQIEERFGATYRNMRLQYSREPQPLGTAGALRYALGRLESDPVLVMNGDSYCGIDLKSFVEWHERKQAIASMALARIARSERYGTVALGTNDRVLQFSEKQNSGESWINAGIYLLSQRLLRSIPEAVPVSLEREVFPRWIHGGLYGYPSPGPFLDIGTPDDFAVAEEFFAALSKPKQRRFIVLDRDGTIIEEREYLSSPEQVSLIPGAAAALHELQQMNYGLVIITNQSGVGRGYFDMGRVKLVHERLERLLALEGVCLDGIYVCPHKPDDDCACRKPSLGLLHQASSELGFEMQDSIVIGDKPCDIDMGHAAGAVTFLVRTGYGAEVEQLAGADFVVDDLAAAVRRIRASSAQERTITDGH